MKYYRVDSVGGDVYLSELLVIRKTLCGVWLELPFGSGKRFVRKDARKRYACPTKDEAIDSFIARKRRQTRILTVQLNRVRLQLEASEQRRMELLTRGYLDVPKPLLL